NGAMVGRVDVLERGVLRPAPLEDGRKRVRAGPGQVQFAAHGQKSVAERLRVEAAARETAEPDVARVLGVKLRRGGARELISLGRQDMAVQPLQRPAVADELGGQVIE